MVCKRIAISFTLIKKNTEKKIEILKLFTTIGEQTNEINNKTS